MRKYLLILLLLPLLAFCAEEQKEVPVTPEFEVTLAKPGDRVEKSLEGKTVIFTFYSATGIGSAKIALTQGEWPENVVLRLRYQEGRGFEGLESFTLNTKRLKIDTSINEAGKVPFRFKDDKGNIGKDAQPAGTLNITMKRTEPYLEITLPAHLPTGSSEMEVGWIDFYRG